MTPRPPATPQAVADAAKDCVSERDAIQANLLDLDASFGARLLAGAALTGQTKARWDAAAASLASLWETFNAYSAVVDQIVKAMAGRVGAKETAALGKLLTEPSIQLAASPAPLAGRDLADSGRRDLTMAAAVERMRRAFSDITAVVSAAEQVWNEATDGLDAAGAELGRVQALAPGLADGGLAGNLTAAQAKLDQLRGVLSSDPLSLYQDGRVDTSAISRLSERVAAVAARVDELVQIRDHAAERVADVTSAAQAARAAYEDAALAWQRAAVRIAAVELPPAPPYRRR